MDKKIITVYDFNDYCEDALTFFCESIESDDRYTRPLTEDEKEQYSYDYPNIGVMYTDRGADLIERYISRLFKIGRKYFDEFDLEIQTSMFQDLD